MACTTAQLLNHCGIRDINIRVISCPKCGTTTVWEHPMLLTIARAMVGGGGFMVRDDCKDEMKEVEVGTGAENSQ